MIREPVAGEIFKSQARKSAVDSVIATVRDLLLSRQLKRGDRLPNEIELTKKLSTSRGSIREAMKILSAYGIIEIKRGDGTYISQSMSNRLFDHLVFQMILSDTDKKKLIELRELIELGIVKIVIANATDEDLSIIRLAHAQMAESVNRAETDPKAMTALDLGFHLAIGKASRNELIRKVYEVTLDLFAPSIEETHRRPDNSRNALRHHQNVLSGLEARDQARTEAAVKESITQWVMLSS
jgi:GntR family transcriptional repressor for pyruvate dehydrogenase complex